MFPLAFVAESLQGHWWGFISRNYVVWPIFFLVNVFIALKGTHFWILLEVLQFRFRTRNILCLEVQQFCFRTQNNLWLEVPQFSTIYCDLNFRNSASARKDVIWNSALLLLHENITFLWKITLLQPHTHFLIFVLSYMTDGPSEGQRNKGIGMLLAKVVVNVWLREA